MVLTLSPLLCFIWPHAHPSFSFILPTSSPSPPVSPQLQLQSLSPPLTRYPLFPSPSSFPDPANPSGPPRELIVKLLSQDPAYPDAPTEGIRRVLEAVTGEKVPRGECWDGR